MTRADWLQMLRDLPVAIVFMAGFIAVLGLIYAVVPA